MHHSDILCLLHKAKYTAVEIAKEEGVSPSFVSDVMRGNKTSHPIAKNIASKVRRSVNTLWPGCYKHAPRPLSRAPKRRKAA